VPVAQRAQSRKKPAANDVTAFALNGFHQYAGDIISRNNFRQNFFFQVTNNCLSAILTGAGLQDRAVRVG
jgi:hypothetical protein